MGLIGCTSLGKKFFFASTLHGVGDFGEQHGLRLFSGRSFVNTFYFARPPMGQRVYLASCYLSNLHCPIFVFFFFIPPTKYRPRRDHMFLCLINTPYRPAQYTRSKIALQRENSLLSLPAYLLQTGEDILSSYTSSFCGMGGTEGCGICTILQEASDGSERMDDVVWCGVFWTIFTWNFRGF